VSARIGRLLARLLELALRGLPTLVLIVAVSGCTNVGTVNWTVTQTTDTPIASPAAAAAGVAPDATPTPAVDSVCGYGQVPYEYADNSGFYCAPAGS
jgi:hypothetical protein